MNNLLFNYIFNFSKNRAVAEAAILLNRFTYVILALILIWVLFFARRKFFSVALLFLTGVSTWLLVNILKLIFHTARPFTALGITPLAYENTFSFPSGHSAVFAAIAVCMFLINKRAGIVLSILALLVGLSRIILGVHYPIDVLGGFVLGSLIGLLFTKLFKKI